MTRKTACWRSSVAPAARRRWALILTCFAFSAPAAFAHTLTITQVLVSFRDAGRVAEKIDIDLTAALGSPEAYAAAARSPAAERRRVIDRLLPRILNDLQLHVGGTVLKPVLGGFQFPALTIAEFRDPATDHFTTLNLTADLPASAEPIQLVVPPGAQVDYPVAFIVEIPSAHISATSWIDDNSGASEEFDWAGLAPRSSPGAAPGTVAKAPPASALSELGTYLRLGFKHIVPQGLDHILFVLGLFFLGITWRKLLAQTTLFTVAHALTLFLSVYGIFRLPGKFVEPAIAASITWVALENVFSPRLGPVRLAVVFAFGLIHGLGFAGSLAEVPFPRHQFFVALLGFNFGVDFGQLFVIALAFLAVGAFRRRPWFRARIAIPASLAIAAIGAYWTVKRILETSLQS